MSVYILYGPTDRDPTELVCQFFPTEGDMHEFTAILPGRYQYMIVKGVSYDDIEVTNPRPPSLDW